VKLSFRFENGTSQLMLSPENPRDKTYLSLCIDGRNDMRLKPTTSDDIIIEFTESKSKSITPLALNILPELQGLPIEYANPSETP